MLYAYREAWLAAVVEHFKRDFKAHGYPLPDRLRVTCGWPSRGGLALKGVENYSCKIPDGASNTAICRHSEA
jgi:hypothetical protein